MMDARLGVQIQCVDGWRWIQSGESSPVGADGLARVVIRHDKQDIRPRNRFLSGVGQRPAVAGAEKRQGAEPHQYIM